MTRNNYKEEVMTYPWHNGENVNEKAEAFNKLVAEFVEQEDEQPSVDMVNQPPHYKSDSGLESIDVIEAFNLDFYLGNTVKYILRHRYKKNPLEDLKKGRWYLDRAIKRMESRET